MRKKKDRAAHHHSCTDKRAGSTARNNDGEIA
jgi:hypothetical protein